MAVQRLRELMPKAKGGDFVDMADRWRTIQSAALRPDENYQKITADELKEMKADQKTVIGKLDRLLQGVRLAG